MFTHYHLMILIIGLMIVSSASLKLVDPDGGSLEAIGQPWDALVRWSKTSSFALTEYTFGLMLPVAPEGVFKNLGLWILSATVLAGLGIQIKSRSASCRCFGVLTPKNLLGNYVMHASMACLVLAASLYGLLYAPSTLGQPWGVCGSIVIAVLSLGVAGMFGRPSKVAQTPSGPPVRTSVTPLPALPASFPLGLAAKGDVVELGSLVKADAPVFVVGVHTSCKACKKLLPDLLAFAKGFGLQFPIVLIANEPGYVDPSDNSIVCLVDPEEKLANHFKLNARPFASLINGATMQPMAPPSMGDNAIRMLFAVTLNARLTSAT